MATTSLPPLSSDLLEARHSGIREIANEAYGMPGAIRLEAGQPDFRTPAHIAEAAKAAIDEGFTFYTPTAGIPPLREALAAQPDLEALERLITPRTKVLLVNSPNNPTGAVYPEETLRRLAGLARDRNLWLISDECYDQIMLDGRGVAPSMANHLQDGRVISVFTFSKSYAMTGWRLGYAVAAPDLIDGIIKFLESTSSCVSAITQKAGVAALDGPQDCVAEMVSAYRRRRDLSVDLLREAGLLVAEPQGAFYVMADVSQSGMGAG